ncbi:uncharacterized protein RBU33_001161 [Hipposideros larvatus]
MPHVELTIDSSASNVQRELALVDADADSTLLYGNPDRFEGPLADMEATVASAWEHGKPGHWALYFCRSVRGGRDDWELYQQIMLRLRHFGVVLNERVSFAGLSVHGEETAGGDRFIHEWDLAWLQQADVVVAQDLATWKHVTAVSLFHYMDDIMLTSDSFIYLEDAAKVLSVALSNCGWAVNEAKAQGPGLSVKFLVVI